ncbi:uncharacterized protein [Amphiura filiformis]|uniref:uncharacterized protein n=1 Tax=Amphiura filiformis TaxID=82378 RepID=UPI003B221D29
MRIDYFHNIDMIDKVSCMIKHFDSLVSCALFLPLIQSFSITKPSDVKHEGLPRSRRPGGIRRTLLDVLRSLCCMVRPDDDQQPGREPCMYECNTEDLYWKVCTGSGAQSQHVQEPIEDISSCSPAVCKDDPMSPSGRSEKISSYSQRPPQSP